MKFITIIILSLLGLNLAFGGELTLEQKLSRFKYLPYNKIIKSSKIKETWSYKRNFVHLEGEDPNGEKKLQTKFVYVKNKRSTGKKPLIIIIQPIYSYRPLGNFMSWQLMKEGFHALYLDYQEDFSDINRPLNELNTMFISMVTRIRTTIDYVEKNIPEVDTSKIGIHGISLGGVLAGMAYSIDKRIEAASLIVTGGRFSNTLSVSSNKLVRTMREGKFKQLELIPLKNSRKYLKQP